MRHLMSRLTSKTIFPVALAFAGVLALSACVSDPEGTPPKTVRQMLIDTGAVEFNLNCSGCHGSEGEGSRGPQVANSDYVMGSKERLIRTVLNGLSPDDTIYVNGVQVLAGGMPPWRDGLSDHQIAGILTYIRVVLNDTLVTNCEAIDEFSATCDRNPRDPQDIATDSISVEEVAAVRDTLPPPSPKMTAGLR